MWGLFLGIYLAYILYPFFLRVAATSAQQKALEKDAGRFCEAAAVGRCKGSMDR
jgi:hypothetical protein